MDLGSKVEAVALIFVLFATGPSCHFPLTVAILCFPHPARARLLAAVHKHSFQFESITSALSVSSTNSPLFVRLGKATAPMN